ncbi:hypothetical protein [Nannocystis pusilla]
MQPFTGSQPGGSAPPNRSSGMFHQQAMMSPSTGEYSGISQVT